MNSVSTWPLLRRSGERARPVPRLIGEQGQQRVAEPVVAVRDRSLQLRVGRRERGRDLPGVLADDVGARGRDAEERPEDLDVFARAPA
jgi:hypothetical protein